MKKSLNRVLLLPVIAIGSAFVLIACDKKEETPAEKVEEAVDDALDRREHEEMKDAMEEVEEAAEDLVEGTKDALDMRENEKAKDAAEDAADAAEEALEEE